MALTPEQQATLNKYVSMYHLPVAMEWATNGMGSRSQEQQGRRAAQQFASLGGQAEYDRLKAAVAADPALTAQWNQMIQEGNKGDFFSRIGDAVVSAAPTALKLAAAYATGDATGLNSLMGSQFASAPTSTMTTAELAAADPYLASIGGASGVTPAMEAAGMASAMSAPGAATSALSNLGAAGLGYGDLGSLLTGASPIVSSIPSNAAQSVGSQAVQQAIGGTSGTTAGTAGTTGSGGAMGTLSDLTGLSENTLSSLLSGATSLYGAQQGVNAANDATAELRRQFDIGQANTAPWLQAGKTALGAQQDLMGLGPNGPEAQLNSLMTAPGYQFRLKQGQIGLDASAAARGGMGSGKAATSAMNWNQDYASNEYNNRLNQLAGVSGTGQTQANTNMQAGMNYAGDVGNSALMAGQMRQSGILGAGKALSDWMNPQPKQMTLADLLKGGKYAY